MVNTCCIAGCTSRSTNDKTITFHRVPTVDKARGEKVRALTEKRRRAWLKQINRENITDKTVKPWNRVCSLHFLTGRPAELYDEDNPDWAPSVDLGYACETGSAKGFERNKKRQKVKDATEVDSQDGATMGLVIKMEPGTADEVPDLTNESCNYGEVKEHVLLQNENEELRRSKENVDQENLGLKSELLGLKDHVIQLQIENEELRRSKEKADQEKLSFGSELLALREENLRMKEKLEFCAFSENSFKDDDVRVKYYTGLPNFVMLMTLVNYLSPHISSGPRSVTSKFQEILMVLMRLRLNLPVQVVADLFSVSASTASRTFSKTLDVMYTRLSPLIAWPDRESLCRTMPGEFVTSFGKKVTVIIDCFELFIETPSNPQARAQTFSTDKHHNTIKYLIGITPQGVVSYISTGWGGRTNNKFLAENSTFLDDLLPGDLVSVGRGFSIHKSDGLMCAEVKMSASTKSRKELSAFDVESAAKIAHARIHVRQVIHNIMQKYPILDSAIPVSFLSTAESEEVTMLDKIVSVCCALMNMCPSFLLGEPT